MDKVPLILFKLPSRGRPERFFKSLESIINNLQDKENFHVSCTLDLDDAEMNNSEVAEKILSYPNTSIAWGKSNSKIHAVNRDIPDMDWDILIQTSDDIFFNFYGFDSHVRYEMQSRFPEGDGYLHFTEKDSGTALCVMTCIDKKYYQRDNYIYHPSYFSLWVDNEQMEVAKIRGRYSYVNYSIMTHENPAYGYLPKDEMFVEQQKVGWDADMKNYHLRKAKNFGL